MTNKKCIFKVGVLEGLRMEGRIGEGRRLNNRYQELENPNPALKGKITVSWESTVR